MNTLLQARSERALTHHQAREVPFPRIFSERDRRIKRVLDVMFAGALGVAALPLMVVIAAAIRLTSRGPVFFSHPRLGRSGSTFRVWKFRTMLADSDAVLEQYLDEHPERALEWQTTHKLKDDPRVTLVGRFLRRSSLDELPQVWNVLRGDMSMVGPRPIVGEEVAKYGSAYVLYSQIKPGLTGLWQVSGRNDVNYRRRVELDTEYIRNWTPREDFSVVFKTFAAVIKGKGAY